MAGRVGGGGGAGAGGDLRPLLLLAAEVAEVAQRVHATRVRRHRALPQRPRLVDIAALDLHAL
jgi:hypothetical protein